MQEIINFATTSFANDGSTPLPPIGKGIGLAFGLFFMQVIASLCMHHFFYRSASTGVLLRGGLIHVIYGRSLKLTAKERGTLTNGLIMNHISTDVSRIDFCAGFFHMVCDSLLRVQLRSTAIILSRHGLLQSNW
jgi:hypothetical protein